MKECLRNMSLLVIVIFFVACSKSPLRKRDNNTLKQDADWVVIDEGKRDSLYKNQTIDDLALRVKDYLNNAYLKPGDHKILNASDKKFNLFQIDLNNNGQKEVFIYFPTSYFCGSGGCMILLLSSDLKLLNRFTVINPPVYASFSTQNGWKVLFVKKGDKYCQLINKNGKYRPYPTSSMLDEILPMDKSVAIDFNKSKLYNF